MDESRKVVLILGNGFDLDLGLKTSYKDFWESKYCPKDYPAPLIKHLNKRWPEKREAVKWYDLENELLNYYLLLREKSSTFDVITEEERDFIKNVDLVSLVYGISRDYIQLAQSLIEKEVLRVSYSPMIKYDIPYKDDLLMDTVSRDNKALQLIKERLCDYLSSIQTTVPHSSTIAFQVLAFLDEYSKKENVVNIFTFNYTKVQLNGRDPDYAKVYYMHGNCKDGKVIIGTRDDFQMDVRYDFLQKSFDPDFDPPGLVTALQEADEIVIFGHSLGENDRQYFKALFKQQTDFSNFRCKDITIFTKDDDSEIQVKRSLQNLTDGNLSALYGLNHFQIIKTGNIQKDQGRLLDFLVKHGKDELATRDFIGKYL